MAESTPQIDDHRDNTPKTCPECQNVLEEGTALSTSAAQLGAAYLCQSCKMIYTRDLQPLARMV